MKKTLLYLTNIKRLSLGISLLLCLVSARTFATTHTLVNSTLKVGYSDSNGNLFGTFSTGTYGCVTSVLSREYNMQFNSNVIISGGVGLNEKSKFLVETFTTNPEPDKVYNAKLTLREECGGKWTNYYEENFNFSISSINSFNTSFSGTTLSATWNKGQIKTTDYTVTLSGKSITNPEKGFQTIESKTVPGTSTSTTFTGLYPGIVYRTEITQNIPGGFTRTASDEVSPALPSSYKVSGFSTIPYPSRINLRWSNPSSGSQNNTYVAANRKVFNLGSSTVFEELKVLADLGRTTTTIPTSYDDQSEINCKDHEYSLRLVFRKGSFEQTIQTVYAPRISYPYSLTDEPNVVSNFMASSMNTPTTCTKDIELSWVEDADRHPCQSYWFDVDRYQLDNFGNKINSSKKTVVNSNGTGVTSRIDDHQHVVRHTFTDTDDSKIEGATYQYEIRTVTQWPAGGVYFSSYVVRTIDIGGDIDVPSGSSVSATIDPASFITLNWSDLSNESSYLILRKRGGEEDAEFTVGQNTTTFTDGVSGDAARCVDYTYEVLGINACVPDGVSLGTVSTGTLTTGGTTNLTFVSDFSTTYSPYALLADKGYERDFVSLEWEVAENSANLLNQKLYRKKSNSSQESALIATLDAGTRSYSDLETNANELYSYYLVADAACGTIGAISNQIQAVGFRTPWGLVNGHVDYTGGIDVEGALISAENPSAQALNKSVYFDGNRDIALIIDDNASSDFINTFPQAQTQNLAFLQGNGTRTFEFWAKPEIYNAGSIFYTGNYSTGPLTFFGLFTPSNNTYNVWNVHLGSEQIQADLAGLAAPGEWHHFAMSYDGVSVKLYVDGSNIDANGREMSWDRTLNTADVPAGRVVIIGGLQASLTSFVWEYKGHLDEFRVWDRAKTQEQIQSQMNGFLFGNEKGLQIYLRMDENYGDFLYDASYEGGDNYHRRHVLMPRNIAGNDVTFSNTIPASDQLGYNAITDAKGNYTIPYIRYRGAGEIFNVVPFIFQHAFRPSNRNLFIGQSSPVHNEQDFEDISAFKVTGTVFYGREEGADTVRYCPAAGLFML